MDDVDKLLRELEKIDSRASSRPATASREPFPQESRLSVPRVAPATAKKSDDADLDDIDALLKSFGDDPAFKRSPGPTASAASSNPQKPADRPTTGGPSRPVSVLGPADPPKTALTGPSSGQSKSTESTGRIATADTSAIRKKCTPLCVGGVGVETGVTLSSIDRKTCSSLRCIKCDWKVHSFEGCWSSRCDYMFFRNNMPDIAKLRINLLPKQGFNAYACQCTWRSVKDIEEISSLSSDIRWVCGGHKL